MRAVLGLLAATLSASAYAVPLREPVDRAILPVDGREATLTLDGAGMPPPASISLLRDDGSAIPVVSATMREPDGWRVRVTVPAGGWYRLATRDGVGAEWQGTARFAVGLVIAITGQSQADAFIREIGPALGSAQARGTLPDGLVASVMLPAGTADPCGADHRAHWVAADDRRANQIGARALAERLSALAAMPVGLLATAWGGVGIEAFAPTGCLAPRIVAFAQAAGGAHAVLMLGHGTSDAWRGTTREAYATGLAAFADMVARGVPGAGGAPPLTVLAPVSRQHPPLGMARSSRLARALLPAENSESLATWLGLAAPARAPRFEAGLRAVRAAQLGAIEAGLFRYGGSLDALPVRADGVHWAEAAHAPAGRALADALAYHLGVSDTDPRGPVLVEAVTVGRQVLLRFAGDAPLAPPPRGRRPCCVLVETPDGRRVPVLHAAPLDDPRAMLLTLGYAPPPGTRVLLGPPGAAGPFEAGNDLRDTRGRPVLPVLIGVPLVQAR